MESNELYQIEILSEALWDMTEIVSSFLMLDNKNGAVRIKNKMNKATLQIAQFPYSGVTVSDNHLSKLGLRMIVVEKYLMFYRIFEDEKKIIFYRVLNGTINYPAMLKKINLEINEQDITENA